MDLSNCPHCNTNGVLAMSDGRCPNCKGLLTKEKKNATVSTESRGEEVGPASVENRKQEIESPDPSKASCNISAMNALSSQNQIGSDELHGDTTSRKHPDSSPHQQTLEMQDSHCQDKHDSVPDKPHNATISLIHSVILRKEVEIPNTSGPIPILTPVERKGAVLIQSKGKSSLVSVKLPKLMKRSTITVSCPECGEKVKITVEEGAYFSDPAVSYKSTSIIGTLAIVVGFGMGGLLLYASVRGLMYSDGPYIGLALLLLFVVLPIYIIVCLAWGGHKMMRDMGAAGIPIDRFKDRKLVVAESSSGGFVGQNRHEASIHSIDERSLLA